MTYTPLPFVPGVVWRDDQAGGTALDATNLNLEENDDAAYAASLAVQVVSYAASQAMAISLIVGG